MKKLIKIFFTFLFLLTFFPNQLSLNFSTQLSSDFSKSLINEEESQISNNKRIKRGTKEIKLKVSLIRQILDYYCIAAAVQTIFAYFNVDNLQSYSQERIYNDLRAMDKDNISRKYISANIDFGNYLTTILGNINYQDNHLGSYFGTSTYEIRTFQEYVYNSLNNNQPLMFLFQEIGTSNGHTVVINGIIACDENPWETQYICMDPWTAQTLTIRGNEIQEYTSHYSILTGLGSIIPNDTSWKQEQTKININNYEIGVNDLVKEDEPKQVLDLRVDTTSILGAKKTGTISNTFSKVALEKFNGEIYNFTWRKQVTKFELELEKIPEDNDNWKGPLIEIEESQEKYGSAFIQGKIFGQINFERTTSLNHLIMHIKIYFVGFSINTLNYAHIWIKTGEILTFIKKGGEK